MTTNLLVAWRAQTATDVATLDAELDQLIVAVRAFKAKAAKVTRRAQRTADRIASVLHDAADARQGDTALPGMEALLDKLAELPSGDPNDAIGGAVDALVEYRGTLAALAREVVAISG